MPLLAGITIIISLVLWSHDKLNRMKKRRTQKGLQAILTYLKDREPRSAMPPRRLCAVQQRRRETRPPSPWRASAASTRTRSLSLEARTPRWGHRSSSCDHSVIIIITHVRQESFPSVFCLESQQKQDITGRKFSKDQN